MAPIVVTQMRNTIIAVVEVGIKDKRHPVCSWFDSLLQQGLGVSVIDLVLGFFTTAGFKATLGKAGVRELPAING